MTKRKETKKTEAVPPPEDMRDDQIEALMPVLVPLLTRAMNVKDYLHKYDRQMRERAVVAIERGADALQDIAATLKKKR